MLKTEIIRWLAVACVLFLGLYCAVKQYEKRGVKQAVYYVLGTLVLSIASTIICDYYVTPFFATMEEVNSPTLFNDSSVSETDKNVALGSSVSDKDKEGTVGTSGDSFLTGVEDISGSNTINGSIVVENQKDSYKYTATVSGIYHFYSDLSSGGGIYICVCEENGDLIDRGNNSLSVDLEKEKTYILCVEYRTGPCDYTVIIGVPKLAVDISDKASISGKIIYQDQSDDYYYNAPTSGTYRFDTDLSAGGGVWVRISGENGNLIDYGTDALTIELEAEKTYILSVKYRTGPCDYTVSLGVPAPILDISGQSFISGNITYKDQEDRYYYTAPTSGTYRFDTDLSAGGGVWVQISGENGNLLDYGTDALTIELEAEKTYILSVKYRTGPCDYTVSLGVPAPILDISGQSFISGNITYKDQKDRYYYIAPTSGTYRFDTDLSAGGGVWVRISGENGNSLDCGSDALTADLEAGKAYILSVEHRSGLCSYEVSISTP